MTNRQVAVLAFKLLGLWLVAEAAIGFAAIPYYWEPQFEGVRLLTVVFTMLPVLVSAAIGIPVWMGADSLAERIFPEVSEATPPTRLAQEPLFALALSIIGVLFVCESIPTVVNGISLFVQSRLHGSSILGPNPDHQRLIWSETAKANSVAGVARLLVGIGLLAGPAKLAAAYSRIRAEFSSSLERDEKDGG